MVELVKPVKVVENAEYPIATSLQLDIPKELSNLQLTATVEEDVDLVVVVVDDNQ